MWTEYSSDLLREHYFMMRHESGLSVYVFPKALTGTYALLATRYGSVDDVLVTEDQKTVKLPHGVAHFLEHKMFENEDGSDSFSRFSAYGADANAYTAYHHTAYLFSCTERFEESLGELLTFVYRPYFTKQTVKKEQGIIAEEIRMYEDNPWERCYQNLLRALYREHPARENICGSISSIKRITPELLYAVHRAYYHPSNMALVVCGDVTREQVLRIVDEKLKRVSLPARLPRRTWPQEPQGVYRKRIRARMQVAKPLFSIGIKDDSALRTPYERLRRDAAMTLLDEILFSRSERFYNELFEAGILTTAFSFGHSYTESFGFNCLSGESNEPETVLSRMMEYLSEVQRTGISDEAFERCRRALYADEIRAYDSTEEIGDRLLSFVFDDVELFSYPTLLQDITKEELERLLCEAFREESISLSVIEPLEDTTRKEETI